MKISFVWIILGLLFVVMVAGCTSQAPANSAQPEVTVSITATPTQAETVIPSTPVKQEVSDPALEGTWYLKLMSDQNGTAIVQTINPETMITFENNSQITGYTGCNDYQGSYSLTGLKTKFGQGIAIKTEMASPKPCANGENTEQIYIQILSGATSYLVNANQELTLTDSSDNSLVYQRVPYNQNAVPVNS